jgi:hypothetical protein
MTPLDKAREIYERKRMAWPAPVEVEPEQLQEAPEPPVIHHGNNGSKEKLNQVVEAAMADQIALVKSINDLKKPDVNSEDEIIGNRFLCRRGGLLFPAPTGIGKSTFTIQTMTRAALGHEAYGLRFVRPTKVLYVQAENDEGDMAEMRDGLYDAMGYNINEMKIIGENFLVLSESNRTGAKLIEYLYGVVREFEPTLIVLDPIFSYLGGNASEQAAVSMFLRNMLNPMLHDLNIAAWLIHHTNKPPTGEQKREWSGQDFAYLGSGSAEWANWARAALAIRQIGLEGTFELRAGKRGGRLGWDDPDGNRVSHRYIAHAKGSICWQDADWQGVQEQLGKGSPGAKSKSYDIGKIQKQSPFASRTEAVKAIMEAANCKERSANDKLNELVKQGILIPKHNGNAVTYDRP